MVEEDDSVVYDGGEVEDVHFILECEEFEWDRWELLDRVRRIVGSELCVPINSHHMMTMLLN